MRTLRGLTLVALFCIDVHVKAEEHKSCWADKLPCAVSATASRRVIEEESKLRLVLAPGALLERREDDLVQLVRGSFYVEIEAPMKFQTPYGRFWCVGECKALFERRATEISLKSLGGDWRIERSGEKQDYALAAGLQILLAEADSSGRAQMDFPQSLPWISTMKQWAALFPGDTEEWKTQAAVFRDVWRGAVESVSDLHQVTARREVAAFDRAQAQERARQKARESEDQSLRDLFRTKNYVHP
jgi:hypothetical protein